MKKTQNEKLQSEIVVVGGGPAGMMAAGRAAELGKKVLLLERNKTLGRKLLLTGKGRCNLTQAEFNVRLFVKEFGPKGKFLFSPLSKFGVQETIDFFQQRGLKTKIERGRRVFPVSNQSRSVLAVLERYLKENHVDVITEARVVNVKEKDHSIVNLFLQDGRIVQSLEYIFCFGGKSYPLTGSGGDGFRLGKKLGHTVTELRPALVPLEIKEKWVKELQGLSLKNVRITVFQNSQKKQSKFGEALFTHFGMSGPIILDLSRDIGELLEKGKVSLLLDLKPALDFPTLDKRIQRDFSKYRRKLFANALGDLLPQKLIPLFIKFSKISPNKKVSKITRAERHRLVKLLKGLEMTVHSLLGFQRAIITQGGISLKEIDARTLKSKIINNLFFAGEIIDLDGPTGGYNLQVCWTTGYVAGENAARLAHR